ncbi:cyanase [Arthrobacter koreensis]|jgi:cyanate lyase|uniref:Cyanate hydratase n=1 Tax=Arthrobacter koreensis TaxID=199136 RepID=A0ABY6FS15_9MICC|nr:cyanase [Arthrobacter koreensis]MEB7447299.1 cyanase [Arthrobacter koreensis]UYB35953.1 cyanase [Arthrobacter koreensis]
MTNWNTTRDQATLKVRTAVARSDSSWAELAEKLDRPLLWTIAALLGSHPVPAELAEKAGELLDLDKETVLALQEQPYRIAGDSLKDDPTIYRFYELLAVYGPALKEAIHEEFGDGIMSAINCNVELTRREDPDGDRVRVIIDGKFLKYQW